MARDRDKRLFAQIEIGLPRHPKVQRLPVEARWAFVEMICEARQEDNDGVFESEDAEFLWSSDVLEALLNSHPSRPLVIRDGDRYVIRDYAKHQVTQARREEVSSKRSEAGKKGAAARWGDAKSMAFATDVPGKSKQAIAEIEIEKEIEEVPKGTSSSSSLEHHSDRPEIESLLDLLDSELARNGTKRPVRNKQNADAARLLIDRDGYTIAQVEYLIRWSQADEFWRANIRSMSKLREKADTLRLQSQRQSKPRTEQPSRTEQAHSFIQRLEAQDAARGSGQTFGDHRELR